MHTLELNLALLRAITDADAETVAALLAQGADANVRNGTALDNLALIVAFRKHITVIPPNLPGGREERLHHYAESLPIIETLLKYGANPDVHNAIGNTPLTLAVRHHKFDLIKLLLRYGANINFADKRGTTPLMWSVIMNDNDLSDHLAIAMLLLDQGAAIDMQNADGNTALSYAVAYTRLPILQCLLERGASTALTDNQGRTPLMYARQSKLRNMDAIQVSKYP